MSTDRVTIHTLQAMKQRGERISMLTCYDATFARLLDQSQVDVILVGDSLGMVIQGHDTTLPVTLEDVIYHTRAVMRGVSRAHVVGDMPFMTYQASHELALLNAGRLLKETGAHAVKLEGGARHTKLVTELVTAGIPVMGHIGLTPQSVHQMGGFKIQGRKPEQATALVEDAIALAEAGAYSIVLEGMPWEIAERITLSVPIPTIGIGAGPKCDGQVLVLYDLLGMNESFRPKFVRTYEKMATRIRTAIDSYVADVKDASFPAEHESFSLAPSAKAKPAGQLTALAHVGGCVPEPGAAMPTSQEASGSGEGGGFYSTPKK